MMSIHSMLGFLAFGIDQVQSAESLAEATAMLSVSRVDRADPFTDPPILASWVEVAPAHKCNGRWQNYEKAASQYDCEQIAISWPAAGMPGRPFYQYNSGKGLCATCEDVLSLKENNKDWQVYRNPALWPLKSMGQQCTGKKKRKQPDAWSQMECQLAADTLGHPYYQWNANKKTCSTAAKCKEEAASSNLGTYYKDLVLDHAHTDTRAHTCTQWNFAASLDPSLDKSFGPIVDPSYTLTKFEVQEPGGADRAHLNSKNGTCVLSFQNTDTTFADFTSDWANNANYAPVKKWGFDGLHSGLVTELEGLIGLMDFNAMHTECSVSLSVTGWSLGGSLAQLFAVLMNAAHNPLHSDLRVASVYSFGAFAPMSSDMRNDQAADGCFAGNQYYAAMDDGTGGYAADVIYNEKSGSKVHSFPHSNKVFILPTGQQIAFPCGTPLPDGYDLFAALNPTGGADWSAYLQAHGSYPFLLGCLQMPN